jgi:hypothetical protein
MSWTVRGSNPAGREILRTRPDRPWRSSNLVWNGYRVYFPRVRRPERDVHHPPPIAPTLKKGAYVIDLSVYKFSTPSSSCALVFFTKMKAKAKSRAAVMVLFYILKITNVTKLHIFTRLVFIIHRLRSLYYVALLVLSPDICASAMLLLLIRRN